MMTTKDPGDAPQAFRTEWYKCEHCEHLHVLMIDEGGEAIATAILSRKMLINMLKAVLDIDPEAHAH